MLPSVAALSVGELFRFQGTKHVDGLTCKLSMNRAVRVGRDVPIAPLDFVD